jgi:1,4-dihydroxy-2-naphthoate octaprenyltransferase
MNADSTEPATLEPTPETLMNPLRRYWLATRPPFLTVTVAGCVLGLAHALYRGGLLNWATALLTLIGATVIHAAINVLNDYYDALNGSDTGNDERIFPFTGGSRFIQNKVFTDRQTLHYGLLLLASGIFIGLVLTFSSHWRLLAIGAIGVFVGWGYSAPPFKLNSRGWGEPCVALGFGVLIPLGTDFVQRQSCDWELLLLCLPYGLLVTNILYINQFPDRLADAAAGKHHWVVRLGPERGKWIYVANVFAATAMLLIAVIAGIAPAMALLSLLPLLVAARAAAYLIQVAGQSAQLMTPIKLTIVSALAHGLTLAIILVFAAPSH